MKRVGAIQHSTLQNFSAVHAVVSFNDHKFVAIANFKQGSNDERKHLPAE